MWGHPNPREQAMHPNPRDQAMHGAAHGAALLQPSLAGNLNQGASGLIAPPSEPIPGAGVGFGRDIGNTELTAFQGKASYQQAQNPGANVAASPSPEPAMSSAGFSQGFSQGMSSGFAFDRRGMGMSQGHYGDMSMQQMGSTDMGLDHDRFGFPSHMQQQRGVMAEQLGLGGTADAKMMRNFDQHHMGGHRMGDENQGRFGEPQMQPQDADAFPMMTRGVQRASDPQEIPMNQAKTYRTGCKWVTVYGVMPHQVEHVASLLQADYPGLQRVLRGDGLNFVHVEMHSAEEARKAISTGYLRRGTGIDDRQRIGICEYQGLIHADDDTTPAAPPPVPEHAEYFRIPEIQNGPLERLGSWLFNL